VDLRQRWEELVANVVAEMRDNRQHPAVLEHDFDLRKLRLPVSTPDGSAEWHSLTVADQDLVGADLRQLAQQFYVDYRASQNS
jgi:hypothetical protein